MASPPRPLSVISLAIGSPREEVSCARCNNKNLDLLGAGRTTFWTSPECGHSICRECHSDLGMGTTTKCPAPGCGRKVQKNKLSTKSLETLAFEKECTIRRQHKNQFNKLRSDFPTLREFTDWQEYEATVLSMALNEGALTGEDQRWLLEQYAENSRLNEASIARNRTQLASEAAQTQQRIFDDEEEVARRFAEVDAADDAAHKAKEELRNMKQEVLLGERDLSSLPLPAEPRQAAAAAAAPNTIRIVKLRGLRGPQPQPLDVRPELDLPSDPAALRELRRLAGGLGSDVEAARTREEMFAGLLWGLE
tara:strand:- start:3184 stop:4107 length:924 start_codon:yes stop_codon:yes gene_type:complete